ncbi:patatin-like phospholipase family protein [Nigerium massiliense]|uniref:patatin-like phospholipase family protein n=1 Tax=Nigerium massiliense TaxID=1522317 RepID=UPI001C43C03C|nr:patatin family protein [Nigerium massiliense]
MRSNVTDTALIFEGGGMRASLTSAIVPVLLEAGIYIDFVAGISAGASNTCNYLSRDASRARQSFVDFTADPRFGSWRTFSRGQGYFNAQYIYEETGLPDQALPFDHDTFLANPASMAIAAFQCSTGRQVWWGKQDAKTMRDLMVRVRASSTMPVLMPPVTIDGEVYVDGALGPDGGIALDAARAAGYSKFLVILTQERGYRKGPQKHLRLFQRHFRSFPAVAEALRDRPANYNRVREELFELERSGDAMLFVPETMPVRNSERNIAKLTAAHELGLAQARRELPAWREFLGVPA